MEKNRVLILGVGNTLLADEGFGVEAMNYLRDNYAWPANVRFVDGATGGLVLMGDLMDCDVAVILDIALCGEKPGTIYLFENGDFGGRLGMGQSMHQTSLEDILVNCDLAGARPITLVFAFEPFDCKSPRAGITPEARAILPAFCEKARRELEERGIIGEKGANQAFLP